MDVHLITTGGLGTYAIEEWGRPHWAQPRLRAHRRSPAIAGGQDQRILYVFGDPRNQLLSFFRRGFMKVPYQHCQHVSGEVNYLAAKQSWTIDEYLQEEYDAYKIREHLLGWLAHYERRYSIMFVRYEALAKPTVNAAMCEWVGQLTPFKFKPRTSDYNTLTDTQRQAINRMFGQAMVMIDKLPDVVEMRCS